LDCKNYGRTLYGWAGNSATPLNLDLSFVSQLSYGPPAVAARNYLYIGMDFDKRCSVSDLR